MSLHTTYGLSAVVKTRLMTDFVDLPFLLLDAGGALKEYLLAAIIYVYAVYCLVYMKKSRRHHYAVAQVVRRIRSFRRKAVLGSQSFSFCSRARTCVITLVYYFSIFFSSSVCSVNYVNIQCCRYNTVFSVCRRHFGGVHAVSKTCASSDRDR